MNIDSFRKVAKKYKAIFFDSFGVIKNYNGIIEGVESTFDWLAEEGIDYIVLTNDASRSPMLLHKNYKKLGVNIPTEKIVSSGMMSRDFLESKIKTGKVAYVGTKNSAAYIEELGFSTISVDKIKFSKDELDKIKALVFLDDEGFDWRKGLNNTVNFLRLRNVPVIVANTDLMYPTSDHNIAIATGGIADLVEEVVNKHFIRFGKPDVQIFGFAFEHINLVNNYSKSDILMVGDTLSTDIIGANKFGIDTALVLTGNTIPDQSEFLIKSSGIIPDYICDSIAI